MSEISFTIEGHTKVFRGQRAAERVTSTLTEHLLEKGRSIIMENPQDFFSDPEIAAACIELEEKTLVDKQHELDHALKDSELGSGRRLGQILLRSSMIALKESGQLHSLFGGGGSYKMIGDARSVEEVKDIALAPDTPSSFDLLLSAGHLCKFHTIEDARRNFEDGLFVQIEEL